MIQALQQAITFDEFVAWLPETSECGYELHRGVIVEIPKPRGKHSKVAGDLAYDVGTAIRHLRKYQKQSQTAFEVFKTAG